MPHVTDQDRGQPSGQQPGLPPGRYGTPRTTPRWALVLLSVVGIALLIPIMIRAVHHAVPEARGSVTGYEVLNDHQVRASVDLDKPANKSVTCTLEARNFYSDIVGSVEVELTTRATSGVVSKTFPTSDKAVVVEVTDCTTGSAD